MIVTTFHNPEASPENSIGRVTLTWRRNVFYASSILFISAALARWPNLIDRPVARWVSARVGQNAAVDYMFFAFDTYFTFSGTALMALIWACWPAGEDSERRSRIIVGVLVAFGAGILSRILQHTLSTHLRPLYDSAVGFRIPIGLGSAPSNIWNSFPSDHVAVFAGLVAVLFTVRSKLAIPAALWTTLVESARLYVGAHFPTDLLGGAALGAACVWGVQGRWAIGLGQRAAVVERSAPGLFYGTAFFVSFQVATLFNDIRGLAGGMRLLDRLH